MAREAPGDGLDPKRLDELIDEAIVDCYDEQEQAAGLFVMIEDNLQLPFTTRILGTEVAVVAVEQDDGDGIVAVCERDGERQPVPLADLPLPSPPPEGHEWIAAYRRWARRRSRPRAAVRHEVPAMPVPLGGRSAPPTRRQGGATVSRRPIGHGVLARASAPPTMPGDTPPRVVPDDAGDDA